MIKRDVIVALILSMVAMAACGFLNLGATYMIVASAAPWIFPAKAYHNKYVWTGQITACLAYQYIRTICQEREMLRFTAEIVDLSIWPVGFADCAPYGIAIRGTAKGECVLAPLRSNTMEWRVTVRGMNEMGEMLERFGTPYEQDGRWIVRINQGNISKETWSRFLQDLRGSQFLTAAGK